MGIQQILLAASSGGIVTPFNYGAVEALAGVGATQATASVAFKTDGAMTAAFAEMYDPDNNDIDDGVTGSAYFNPPVAGAGTLYWLEVLTPSVGTFTTGTLNTRQQLSTQRNYTCTTTGTGITRNKYVKADFRIWDAASGGNQVGSGTLTLKASVDNS